MKAQEFYNENDVIAVVTTEPFARFLDYLAPEGGCKVGSFLILPLGKRKAGFTWLENALTQMELRTCASPNLDVCGHNFFLQYDPARTVMDGHAQRGSLAICHQENENYEGVTFRYTLLVKNRIRGYVQWGNSTRICTTADADDMLFGPNVCEPPSTPSGIFGLSHAELIESEWLVDDALTVKVKIELRPQIEYLDQESLDDVVVPPSTIGDKMLHLLDTA